MSQIRWTYVDDYGRRYKVGLYHGDRSGHLMIYCNSRILVIDFHVRDTKKYSFFINDELFDIHVERKDGKFGYGFEIDNQTRTPRNIRRAQIDRSNLWTSLAVIVIFIAIIVAAFLVFR